MPPTTLKFLGTAFWRIIIILVHSRESFAIRTRKWIATVSSWNKEMDDFNWIHALMNPSYWGRGITLDGYLKELREFNLKGALSHH